MSQWGNYPITDEYKRKHIKMKRPFEKGFSLPFRTTNYSWVYDANRNFAFQIIPDLPKDKLKELEDILNGKLKPTFSNVYAHEGGFITVNGKKLILIRGWGFLTGSGGLHLSDKEASEIQDDLANYIVDKLNNKAL